MYPAHGNKKFGGGGGKKFGGPKPIMHRATCGKCGRPCEVPFKPFGNRPVFCNLCFKKDGDFAPTKFGRKDDRRPSFAPHAQRLDQAAEQWRTVNAKLDAILDLLQELD